MAFFSKLFGGSRSQLETSSVDEVEVVSYTIPQLAEAFGFYPATPEERYGDLVELHKQAEHLPNTVDGLTAFIALIQPHLDREARLPWGSRLATVAAEWAPLGDVSDGPDAGEEFVAPAKAVYQQYPSSLTASIYGYACLLAGWHARGQGYSDSVDRDGATVFNYWVLRGWDVLKDYQKKRETDGPVLTAADMMLFNTLFSSAMARADLDLMDDVYEKASQIDPADLVIIQGMAYALLPRWYGKDGAVDAFAREATEASRSTLGAGAYAYIYGRLCKVADYDLNDTQCDPEYLDQGFKDLRQRFVGNLLHNMHAQAMSWADNEKRVLEIFEEGLKAIDHSAWTFSTREQGFRNALYAFVVARNVAADDNIYLDE